MIKKITAFAVMGLLCLKKQKAESRKAKAAIFIAYKIFKRNMLTEVINKPFTDKESSDKLTLSNIPLHLSFRRSLIIGLNTIFICLMFNVGYGQAINSLPQTFKVGDKLPESFWQQEHQVYQHGKVTKQNLSAYKGKLLVLDFWASWCTTCLKKFPKLDSIQQVYADKVNFLLVNAKKNGDDLIKVKQNMDLRGQNGGQMQLASIYGDSLINNYFPHRSIPHYAWISDTGEVIAITGYEFIHPLLIEMVIEKRHKKLKL